MTGMPITAGALAMPVADNELQAGGLRYAYRRGQSDPSKPTRKPLVLFLHGIGSSSYCWRNVMGMLGGEGYETVAVDWPGHGGTDKPTAGFDYSKDAYVSALDSFVKALGTKEPVAVVVHGYILGQYGLLWAMQNPDLVDRVMVVNTPLALSSKLRPELQAYKNPLAFLRPKPGSKFDAMSYNASGSPYAMQMRDAEVYDRPYSESPAASQAIASTMDKVDFPKLLREVDEEIRTWRRPTMVIHGSSDPFLETGQVFDFLEDKRTNVKSMATAAKMGHMPQEDYAEALRDNFLTWLTKEPDQWMTTRARMVKKGVVEFDEE